MKTTSIGGRGRRRSDDLADRALVVEDVAQPRLEPLGVEGLGAVEPDLFLRRENELDAAVGPPLLDDAADGFQHDRDGGLVVGAEDRRPGVSHDAVLDDGLDRLGRRHGVEVRAEEDRRAAVGRRGPRVQVAGGRADPRAGVVLVDVEPELAEVSGDAVGDRRAPLRAGSEIAASSQKSVHDVRKGHGADSRTTAVPAHFVRTCDLGAP